MIIKTKENLEPRGEFCLRVWKHHKDGGKTLLQEYEEHNLIVNGGREQVAHLIAGDYNGRRVTRVGFGTSNATALPTDTSLTNPYTRAIKSFTFPDFNRVQFNWDLPVNEANGMAISEFGLFCEDGTLFSHKIRVSPLNKEDDISFEGQWVIVF
jgi:hypothetical protein